ncbi:MAG: hypothetical protein JWM90_1951 [Thermoleophilia bacterium]|nr:hypothetical protein [Thermoleophilia bacterium]
MKLPEIPEYAHPTIEPGRRRPRVFSHPVFWGYASLALGLLAFASVLCFHFPQLLTSVEVRAIYSEAFARYLLLGGLIAAFGFGTIAVLKDQARASGLGGVALATASFWLGGATVEFDSIESTPYSLGLDWFVLSLFFSAVVFIPLEHYFAHRHLSPLRPGWRTDAAYFFTSHVFIQFLLIAVTVGTTFITGFVEIRAVKEFVVSMPLWLQFLVAVFVADLAQALIHRTYHRVMPLWRFHAVHHSSRELDWLAGSRIHFVETVLTRSVVLLPLLVFGFAQPAVNAYIILVGLQAVVAHANIGVRFGWLEYLVVLPRYHHWHHARHKLYWDRNYAIHLPVVDMLMGTFKLPRDGSWPEEYGVMKLETVPNGFVAQHLMPFQGGRKYDDFVN